MKQFSITHPVVMQLTVPWRAYTKEVICLVVESVDHLTVNPSCHSYLCCCEYYTSSVRERAR